MIPAVLSLPFDPAAEGSVAATVTAHGDALGRIAGMVVADDFYDPRCARVIAAASLLNAEPVPWPSAPPADAVCLSAAFDARLHFNVEAWRVQRMAELADTEAVWLAPLVADRPTLSDARREARIVAVDACKRRVMAALAHAYNSVPDGDLAEIAANVRAMLDREVAA